MHKEIGMGGYILKNGCIVTMDSERRVIPKGTVAVLDGEIVWVGEGAWDAKQEAFSKVQFTEIDCEGKCVLPGFIDCGGYAGFGYLHHLSVENKDKEAKEILSKLPADFFRTEGRCVARQRIGLGYTTGVVNYPWPDQEKRDHYWKKVQESLSGQRTQGIRMVAGAGIPAREIDEKDKEKLLIGMREEEKKSSRLSWRLYLGNLVGDQERHGGLNKSVSCEETASAVKRLRAVKELKVPLTANVFKNDVTVLGNAAEDIWEGNEWLFQYGNDLTYREIMEIARHKIAIAHGVEESIRYCPFAEMLERGIPCALMNENGFRGGSLDPFQTARRAQMIEQLRFDDLYYLPVGKQLELMTVDAARALGIDKKTGSLEPGKRGDIITVDLRRARTTPFYDMPVHRLMMDGNSSHVAEVMVDGELLVEKGKLLRERTDAEKEQEDLWAQKLKSFLDKDGYRPRNTAGEAYAGL